MSDLGAFFGNPNIQRQGARARALAAQRDVNTLADPLTYAAVQGLLGTAPDEMGFSVLNPDYEKIRKVAEPAFALGLLGQASPLLAPMTKGLPVGASIKNVGDDYFKLNSLLTKASQDLSKNPSKETYDAYQSLLKARDAAPNNPSSNIKAVSTIEEAGYRGEHTAPLKDSGKPAHDLIGAYPEDFYSANGVQYYGTGDVRDASVIRQFQSLKDRPNATITVYRAVPKDTPRGKGITQGDWITTDYQYAKEHGEGALNGDYRIVKKEVKARDIFTNGDSIYEWGYDPQPRIPKVSPKKEAIYPQKEALDTAQRNAALPIEEGGLGLPKDNTPEMRAQAMGYDVPAYHGTTVWEAEDGRKLGDIEAFNRLASTEIVGRKPSIDQVGIWASDRPDQLGAGMYSGSQGAIYPLLLRMENPKTTSFEQMSRTASNLSSGEPLAAGVVPRVSDVEPYRQMLKEQGFDSLKLKAKEGSPYTEFADQTGYVLLEPSQVRSRNAAFDPKRRNEADILAGVLPLGLLADEEQRKKLYELMPSLLGE